MPQKKPEPETQPGSTTPEQQELIDALATKPEPEPEIPTQRHQCR